MPRPNRSDLSLLLKGLSRLGSAAIEVHGKEINKAWSNSFVKPLAEKSISQIQEIITDLSLQPNISKNFNETISRLSVVRSSIVAYISKTRDLEENEFNFGDFKNERTHSELNLGGLLKEGKQPSITDEQVTKGISGKESTNEILENLDSLSYEAKFAQDGKQLESDTQFEVQKRIKKLDPPLENLIVNGTVTDEQLEAIDQRLLELTGSEYINDFKVFKEIDSNVGKSQQEQIFTVLANEPDEVLKEQMSYSEPTSNKANYVVNTPHVTQTIRGNTMVASKSHQELKLIGRKPLAKDKATSTLSSDSQARKVPQSRLSRLFSFGGLAAGLGVGTLAEITRRTLGVKGSKESGALLDSSPFLTEANAKRIVDTLCKVRGAALKLGQMLSIQDNSLINPELQRIFERVRQSADFMPTWQLERTLIRDFGPDWRSLVASFDDRPFAAASIGQVHQALLHDGRSVAMKIQYPGVAEGIESDINNLISTLNMAKILPEGFYVDSVIEVAKRELAWECDYVREKECTKKFHEFIQPFSEYYVPEVVEELCTPKVFTSELIEGIPVDKCIALDQISRDYISSLILKLCLMEVFKFGFMQTDPNWANFFYNKDTQQLALLDFGACREYDKKFVDKYINVIHGAATMDRDKVYEFSKQLGFLTGYEAKVMVDAHIDAVMILGETFQHDDPFNFGHQDTTKRIQQLIPVMLSHRMCPPPEESYSLHRKMSGVFLLCAKLGGVINCKPFFDDLWNRYEFGGTWESIRKSSA